MNYKMIIYVITVLCVSFSMSSVDLNKIFKQNKVIEANMFAVILILAIAELVSSFIINFLEVSKIL